MEKTTQLQHSKTSALWSVYTEQKQSRFQMGSWQSQFGVYIYQRQISKKLLLSLSFSVSGPLQQFIRINRGFQRILSMEHKLFSHKVAILAVLLVEE